MSKSLLEDLRNRGLLNWGSHIPGELVREVLNLEYPEYGTKKQFDEVALAELQAVDYVRNTLLNEGKYLAGVAGDYRVLLPSENKRQVEQYMNQADNKLKRALRLSKHTPKLDTHQPSNVDARIMLKRESIRSLQGVAA